MFLSQVFVDILGNPFILLRRVQRRFAGPLRLCGRTRETYTFNTLSKPAIGLVVLRCVAIKVVHVFLLRQSFAQLRTIKANL